MPSHPRSAAIYALNEDVLSHIFSLNGDMFTDHKALDTTRFASQVCRQWRDLLLETPSLWAKLIDICSIYTRRTNEWRNELVQRSGDAPLWIMVAHSVRTPVEKCFTKFFFELITGNWHRIQKLAIHQYSNLQLTRAMSSFPAPKLEYCEAPFNYAPAVRNRDGKFEPLFSNHVPMLRSIHISSHVLDQQAPWLCRIHSLVLDRMYSIPKALAILSATHALRELKIVDIRDDSINSPLPTVFLPRLKVLEYPRLSSSGVALLEQIMVPGDCSLVIRFRDFVNRADLLHQKSHILSVIGTFIRHIERSLQSNVYDIIDITYEHRRITCICTTAHPIPCILNFSMHLCGDSDGHVLEAFIKKLLSLEFTSVTKLRFIANRRLNPFFALFFSCLTSVKIMTTDLRTLSQLAYLQNRFIMKATKQSQIIFPMLAVINLTNNYWAWYPVSSINQVAATFFLLRSQEGYPITKLYMTNLHPFDAPPDLHTLSAVKGLNVFYRLESFQGVVEYTYGKFGEMYQYHSSYVPTF